MHAHFHSVEWIDIDYSWWSKKRDIECRGSQHQMASPQMKPEFSSAEGTRTERKEGERLTFFIESSFILFDLLTRAQIICFKTKMMCRVVPDSYWTIYYDPLGVAPAISDPSKPANFPNFINTNHTTMWYFVEVVTSFLIRVKG